MILRRQHERVALLMVGLLLGGCARSVQVGTGTPRQPAPLNPVGNYEFTTTVNGSPVAGSMVVTRTAGTYGGTITTDMTGDLPITAVAVEGNVVSITADTPQGPVSMRMTVQGEQVSGTWVLGDSAGDFQGKRVTHKGTLEKG